MPRNQVPFDARAWERALLTVQPDHEFYRELRHYLEEWVRIERDALTVPGLGNESVQFQRGRLAAVIELADSLEEQRVAAVMNNMAEQSQPRAKSQ